MARTEEHCALLHCESDGENCVHLKCQVLHSVVCAICKQTRIQTRTTNSMEKVFITVCVTCSKEAHIGCLQLLGSSHRCGCNRQIREIDIFEQPLSGPIIVVQCSARDIAHNSQTSDARFQPFACRVCRTIPFVHSDAAKDEGMIFWPCACSQPLHRRCVDVLIRDTKTCLVCKTSYKIEKFGTICDYFGQHRCRLGALLSTIITAVLSCSYAVYLFTNQPTAYVSCIVFVCVFLLSFTVLVVQLLRLLNTLAIYKERYSRHTVIPFQERKQLRFIRSLRAFQLESSNNSIDLSHRNIN